MEKKLQKGESIFKETISIAGPAMAESFFVAFAGLVDSFMVSSLGADAVAAVGLTTQPKFIGLSLFFALNLAISALVARRFGEKNRKNANEVLLTAMVFLFIAASILTTIFVIFAPTFMRWCGSSDQTHSMSVIYFRVVMGGMIFNCIQMAVNSAQRGAGNTKITMRTNLVSNLVNIIFNYLLIGGKLGFPRLGIFGAALATVLGSVVAAVMSILSICKKNNFISIPFIVKEKLKSSITVFKSILKIGYSVFLEQILMRIGFLLTALMAAKQGDYGMAAHQVGMNLMGLSFSFGDGLQVTAVALIGRSLGEKNPDLAKRYGQMCRKIGMIISIILAIIYFSCGQLIYSLFFKEPEIISYGVHIIYVMIFILFFQISQVVFMGSLRGAGDTLFTAIVAAISASIIRTAGSYICGFILNWGLTGIWIGILADQMTRMICGAIRFGKGKWVKIKL